MGGEEDLLIAEGDDPDKIYQVDLEDPQTGQMIRLTGTYAEILKQIDALPDRSKPVDGGGNGDG